MVQFEEVKIDVDLNQDGLLSQIEPRSGFACGMVCENGMACGLGCGAGVGSACGVGCDQG